MDQEGLQFTGYGYLSSISGLDASQISTIPFTLTETTAHFTYYATATVTSRAVIANLFMLDSVGLITFYYQATPSATFTNPLSFAGGTSIATATVDFQNLIVQAPNQGLATGMGEFTFLFNGQSTFYAGCRELPIGPRRNGPRVSTYGQGIRTDAVLPRFLCGTGRERRGHRAKTTVSTFQMSTQNLALIFTSTDPANVRYSWAFC